jgi:hypothetical protein
MNYVKASPPEAMTTYVHYQMTRYMCFYFKEYQYQDFMCATFKHVMSFQFQCLFIVSIEVGGIKI